MSGVTVTDTAASVSSNFDALQAIVAKVTSVTVTDIATPDRVATGKIVDISQSGLGAELSLCFAAGAIIKMQIGRLRFVRSRNLLHRRAVVSYRY